MSEKIKNYGFNYFSIFTEENGVEKAIDITNLLEEIRLRYLENQDGSEEKIIYNYKGEPAKLAGISVDNNQYYHLWFERLLNYQLPIITTLHGDADEIEIDENEYVGHEVNVLYDARKNVLMIQRNRDSLGPTAIEAVLKMLVTESELASVFYTRIILDQSAKRRGLNKELVRRFQYKVSGEKAKSIVNKIFGNDEGIQNIEIILTSGSKKLDTIDSDIITPLLNRLINDEDVSKLQINGKETEDSRVEKIDLLNHKLQSTLSFDYRESRRINPYKVFEKMLECYHGNVNEGLSGMKNQI